MRETHLTIYVVALLVLGTGCGQFGPPVSKDFHWHQVPGEILTCNYFKLDNDQDLEIGWVQLAFGDGSHHVHVYRADDAVPDSVDDCPNGIDWNKWHLVVGAQTKPVDWTLPGGVTIPLDRHQQMLVQIHWLNTTPAPQDYDINLAFHPVSSTNAHLGVVFGVNKDVTMAPYASKTAEEWCPIGGPNLLAIMGHFHSRGVDYRVTQRTQTAPSGPVVYSALGEQTLNFDVYSPVLSIAPGDGLDFRCDFVNTTDQFITWGPNTVTQEHCNMAAYYYPASGNGFDLCLNQDPDVASISPSPTRVMAGDRAELTVQLSGPAPESGTDIFLSSSDPTSATVPPVVHVGPGVQQTTFLVAGVRPSRPVVIQAQVGSSHASSVVGIDGLALAELPRAPVGAQWIEIQNLSAVSIDLSQYSLGVGGSSYTSNSVALSGILPPAGCFVVGEIPSADQMVAFQPGMVWDSTAPNGIALFDVPEGTLTDSTIPFDAYVWGANNTTLLDANGEVAQAQPLVPAGWAFRRQTASQWVADPAPSPGICEVQW